MSRRDLVQTSVPRVLAERVPGVKRYTMGERMMVLVSRDKIEEPGSVLIDPFGRWHMSISHEFRYPHWDEIVEARQRLLPDDIFFAMGLPPERLWLSHHHHCFHLWELRDQGLTELWTFEGEMARQSGTAEHTPEDSK